MGRMVVTFPHLDISLIPYLVLWLSYPMVYESFLCLCAAIATRVCFVTPSCLLVACVCETYFVTPSGIPWFHNGVTHLVVVDS
jgi:hypothetical protein